MTIESFVMTKKTSKKESKKTAKKVSAKKTTAKKTTDDKSIGAATLEKINSKLTSTKKDLENQVEDLSAQVKKLGKKSGKKALKMLQELDGSYQRRLLNLQAEFEEGMATMSTVQDKVLERLPNSLAEKITSIESGIAKSVKSVTGTNKKPVAKPVAKPVVKPIAKPAAKPASKISKPRPKAAPKKPTIASIKGIGPVMQKKLAEKGITTLDDIANTPKSKIQTLKQFEKERGFNTWKEQAKALLAAT
jgi:predicted flap endonuclease-1-like 5' DNA nuclease